jgi:hypothetical protein
LTRTFRLVVLTVVAAIALGFGSTAFAAYDPSLLVAGTSHALNGAGPVVIGVGQNENDDATGVATIYSPRGYGVTLTQAAGSTLGSLSGTVKVGALGGARVDIQGTVRTDNPATHVSNACSPGLHEAIWILEFTLAGNQLRLPMYVDRVTAGPEAAFASARMRVCLGSPYHPPPAGAQAGASLIVAAFSVRGVFTNPGTRGSYPWNAVFVPWTPGAATPTLNTANAAQSTSITRLPVQLSLTAKRQRRGPRGKRRTFARVTACLTESGQAIRGVRVNILAGATARRARRVAFGRTNSRGCVIRTIRVRTRALFIRASTSVPARDATAGGCQPTIAARCTDVSIAPALLLFSRNTVRVRR